MDPLIGHSLGQYQILAEIGRGGMGVVYRAYDPRLLRPVAIKVLPPMLAFYDASFIQRFRQEGVLAAGLRHPGIVRIYDVGRERDLDFIIMEYLEGMPLDRWLESRSAVTPAATSPILRQVADALDYAHGRGVVHRDIKPANIMLGPDGRATLMDFGLVRALEGSSLTRTGVVVGTPEYMSPEQAMGGPVDGRSDVYSLGVVVYRMLSGRVPFAGSTPYAITYAHIHEPPPPLRRVRGDLPPAVEAAVMRALAKRPEHRYDRAGLLADAFTLAARSRKPVRRPHAVAERGSVESRQKEEAPGRLGAQDKTAASSPPAGSAPTAVSRWRDSGRALLERLSRRPALAVAALAVFLLVVVGLVARDDVSRRQSLSHTPASPSVSFRRNPLASDLFFVSDREETKWEVYRLGPDGQAARFTHTPGSGGSWSPVTGVGGNLFFTSNREDSKRELYRLDPSGQVLRFTHSPRSSESWSPAPGFSGDLFFTSDREEGKREIYRLDSAGRVARFTHTPGSDGSWSPAPALSGDLFFTSDRGEEKREVYRLDPSGRVDRFTYTPGSAGSWSPAPGLSGDLFFTSDREDGKPEIYRLNSDGKVQRYTHTPGKAGSWSPHLAADGSLLFVSDRGGRTQLYRLTQAGNPEPVAQEPGSSSWLGEWVQES
jgi:serine/threonine protein kinase